MMRVVGVQGSCLTGIGLIVYAGWLAWPPLAFALAGALLCAFGLFIQRGGK